MSEATPYTQEEARAIGDPLVKSLPVTFASEAFFRLCATLVRYAELLTENEQLRARVEELTRERREVATTAMLAFVAATDTAAWIALKEIRRIMPTPETEAAESASSHVQRTQHQTFSSDGGPTVQCDTCHDTLLRADPAETEGQGG